MTRTRTFTRQSITTGLTVLTLAFGSLAIAQGGPNNGPGRDDQRRPGPPQQQQHQPQRATPPQHADNRGGGPDHAFRKGGRLPSEYRSKQYVVNDWRGHRLSAPPRGYQWVQTGGDYLLVAVATGVIAQVLLGN